MGERNFNDLLYGRWSSGKFVCVGLDSELSRLPSSGSLPGQGGETARLAFNRAIIDATAAIVCSYKLNSAFYEAQGPTGFQTLIDTVAYLNKVAPDVPVILDAKRADIGNTNSGYVDFAFDTCGVDAITVHPYLGKEALQPFLDRANKGIIVLCRTSNPGAGEFQDLPVTGDAKLYAYIAEQVARSWNTHGNCALVVGATYPGELAHVRQIAGDLPFLIPGIGAQGGDVEAAVAAGKDSRGTGMIINSSRGILFASSGPDFAEAAREATVRLHEHITNALAL